MMNGGIDIKLGMSGADGAAFVEFWRRAATEEGVAGQVAVDVRPPPSPRTGFAFPGVVEVVASVPAEALAAFAGAAAAAVGKGLGSWLWGRLKRFFREEAPTSRTSRKLTIQLGQERITIAIEELDDPPPPLVRKLDDLGGGP